jgi:hypothetical protein
LPQSVRLTLQWWETVPLHHDSLGQILPHNAGNEWLL